MTGFLYSSYMDTLGASGLFAAVRGRDDERSYQVLASELADLKPRMRFQFIFSFLYEYLYLSLPVLLFIRNSPFEDITTACAQLISKASNDSGCACSDIEGQRLESCHKHAFASLPLE